MVFPASWGKIKTFIELKRLNCSNKNFHNKNPTKNRSSSIGFLGHFYIHNGIDNSILYTNIYHKFRAFPGVNQRSSKREVRTLSHPGHTLANRAFPLYLWMEI